MQHSARLRRLEQRVQAVDPFTPERLQLLVLELEHTNDQHTRPERPYSVLPEVYCPFCRAEGRPPIQEIP